MQELVIKKLSKSFTDEAGDFLVLDRMDLTLPHGCIVSVEGASGSGKSTLLNIIGTLDSSISGEMYYGTERLDKISEKEKEKFRLESLGFIFQHHYLLPDFTVLENTMMPLLIRRISWKEAREESQSLLERVGLSARCQHYPFQISGGEMARAGVARALVGNKSLILADEPTGNLDRDNSENLVQLLWDLQKEFGFSMIIVTHDRDLAVCIPIRYQLLSGTLTRLN